MLQTAKKAEFADFIVAGTFKVFGVQDIPNLVEQIWTRYWIALEKEAVVEWRLDGCGGGNALVLALH